MCDLPLEDVASLTGYENINKCIILYVYCFGTINGLRKSDCIMWRCIKCHEI